MQASELALQRAADVERTVRHRENPLSALDLERYAQILKKCHGAASVKTREGAVEKAPVPGHMGDQLIARGIVRHVAAALARDVELFAQAFIRLQQRDADAGA